MDRSWGRKCPSQGKSARTALTGEAGRIGWRFYRFTRQEGAVALR